MKLRSRLLIGLSGIVAAFALTGWVIADHQRQYLTDQVDRQLEGAAPFASRVPRQPDAVDPPAGSTAGSSGDAPPSDAPPTGGPGSGPAGAPGPGALSELFFGRLGDDGVLTPVIAGELAEGVPDVTLADTTDLAENTFTPFTADGVGTSDRFRVLVIPKPDGKGWDVIALSLARADAAYQRLLIAFGIGALAVLAVAALIAVWVLRLGVRPINEMADAADAITAGDTRRRVPSYPDGTEAGRLSTALNTMLDGRQEDEEKLRQFVADASHELRTPLTSIRGYTDLYERGAFATKAALDDALGRVNAEATRMSALVDQLLLLSRLDHGPHDDTAGLDVAVVDLGPVLRDTVADARAVQPNRPMTLALDGDLVVRGDEARLRQVAAVLVHNALTHTPETAAVDVCGTSVVDANGGRTITIEVADEGPGIAPEHASRVFERFVRGDDSRSRGTGGSGLGLAIADGIVRSHHGSLGLTTAVGQGCRFIVTLPALADQVIPPTPGAAPTSP